MNKFKLNGKTLIIEQQCDCIDNPRSWDNFTRMIFFGKYSHVGDKHDVKIGSFSSRADFMLEGAKVIAKAFKGVVLCKPVHLYSHSGESISTNFVYPYNCQWDSGTIGFAIVTKEDIKKNWGIKRVTKEKIAHADRLLEGEVKVLDQYISGEVYGFRIEDKDGNIEDSCGGFYGSNPLENGIIDHVGKEWEKVIRGEK